MVLTNHGSSLGTLGNDTAVMAQAAPSTDRSMDGSASGLRQWLGRSLGNATEKLGERYLRRLAGVQGPLTDTVAAVPARMHRSAEQARLVIEMLEDVRSGKYRKLHWYSLPVAAAAVLYAINPADVVPDVLPVLGSLDDVVLLALAVRVLRNDLREYCRFKGYSEEQFFEQPS